MAEFSARPCGLIRRLAAISYDTLLLLALLMLATLLVLPLTGGNAVERNNLLYDAYLLVLGYLYFGWQWVHGGQTLGMKAWRIRIITEDRQIIGWTTACLRFFCAMLSWLVLGGGFIWSLFDKNKMALHDHMSKTILIVEPKKQS